MRRGTAPWAAQMPGEFHPEVRVSPNFKSVASVRTRMRLQTLEIDQPQTITRGSRADPIASTLGMFLES
jgi:hypothetical protein